MLKMCELCGKAAASGIHWYIIDDNAEVELHTKCASLIRKNAPAKVEAIKVS